ncbi:MAG: hypothetical protein KC620_13420, partial [Myxococcales bacterium]|nr:hypothetical protein [Myxococcales bacterium]
APVEDVALHRAYDEAFAMGHAEGLEAGRAELAERTVRLLRECSPPGSRAARDLPPKAPDFGQMLLDADVNALEL